MSQTAQKRIIVVGATGSIGRALCRRLLASGYEVVFSAGCIKKESTAITQINRERNFA